MNVLFIAFASVLFPLVLQGCGGDGSDAHGNYTVKEGDTCLNIAKSICNGSDWEHDICNSAVCGPGLQPGQVLEYDCSGTHAHCSSSPGGHGNHTVKPGETCRNIADDICKKGDDWEKVICNNAKCGPGLQPDEVLRYDCSGTRAHCPAVPGGHGSHTVKPGETCRNIAEDVCSKGDDWEKVMCNNAKCGPGLQPDEVLKYDCSGTGAYCGSAGVSVQMLV